MTVLPIIILVVIAIPSFRLLYFTDRTEEAEMTIKAIGHQWYWSYEYPDFDDFSLDAFMIQEREDLEEGQPWLLETDIRVMLPVDTTIRILVTADDVIHAWAVPAFGIKIDAVPGRLNETWVRADREGVFYGQCSELCGGRPRIYADRGRGRLQGRICGVGRGTDGGRAPGHRDTGGASV